MFDRPKTQRTESAAACFNGALLSLPYNAHANVGNAGLYSLAVHMKSFSSIN